jgi:hypothetical protein
VISEVLNVLWMRLKLGWFKGPLDFQLVTTIGEFFFLAPFFFLIQVERSTHCPLVNLSLYAERGTLQRFHLPSFPTL